jgi:hypothetical protein
VLNRARYVLQPRAGIDTKVAECYLAAFERERPKRVWLVFDDRRNPTIAAAEETLRQRGVEVLIQSGPLADDLRVLLSARRLVASIGTLALAVGMLSRRIDTCHQFTGPPNPVLKLKGLRIVRAQDEGEAAPQRERKRSKISRESGQKGSSASIPSSC